MNTNRQYLFVYGTLKLDASNTHAKNFHQQAEYLGVAKWPGSLYLISYYPGAVSSGTNQEFVHGELWKLNNSEQTLEMLDVYEECSVFNPLPHEYKRSYEKVWFAGQLVDAWVYIYQADTSALKKIVSGIFIN